MFAQSEQRRRCRNERQVACGNGGRWNLVEFRA